MTDFRTSLLLTFVINPKPAAFAFFVYSFFLLLRSNKKNEYTNNANAAGFGFITNVNSNEVLKSVMVNYQESNLSTPIYCKFKNNFTSSIVYMEFTIRLWTAKTSEQKNMGKEGHHHLIFFLF